MMRQGFVGWQGSGRAAGIPTRRYSTARGVVGGGDAAVAPDVAALLAEMHLTRAEWDAATSAYRRRQCVGLLVAAGWDPSDAGAAVATWGETELLPRLTAAIASAPGVRPETTPETTPGATPETTPEATPEATPDAGALTEAERRTLARLGVTAEDWRAWRVQGTERAKLAQALQAVTGGAMAELEHETAAWPAGELLSRAEAWLTAHPRASTSTTTTTTEPTTDPVTGGVSTGGSVFYRTSTTATTRRKKKSRGMELAFGLALKFLFG